MAVGEFSEDPAGLGEADVGALPDSEVPLRLGDMRFAHPDRAEQNDGLARMQPAQGAQVPDLGGGQFRGGGEVELLQSDLLLELGPLEPALEGDGLAAGDLVLAEELKEFEVAELAAVGLGEAGVEGLQHAREPQGLQ